MSVSELKPRILFLCTGNSCRSQMAEGIARHHYHKKFQIESAGIEKHGMNRYAVEVMDEAGIDISSHSSKTLDEIGVDFDYVITVCDHAHEHCPSFPASTVMHHVPFDDPPKLAADAEDEEGKLQCYREVRDEIRQQMDSILHDLG